MADGIGSYFPAPNGVVYAPDGQTYERRVVGGKSGLYPISAPAQADPDSYAQAKRAFEQRYGVNGMKLYADKPATSVTSATGIGEAIQQYGIDPFSGMVADMPQEQVIQPRLAPAALPVAAPPAPAPAPYVPIDRSKRIPTISTEQPNIGTLTMYDRPDDTKPAGWTGGIDPVTGEQMPAPPTAPKPFGEQGGGGGFTSMPAAEMASLAKAEALGGGGIGDPISKEASDAYDAKMAELKAKEPTGNLVLDELNRQKAEHDRYSWPEMLRKGQAAGIPMGNIIEKYNELQKMRPPALTAEQEKIRYEAMAPGTVKVDAKNLTEVQLIVEDLKQKLKRNPTPGEILDAQQARKAVGVAVKPPPSRKVLQGNQVVTQEWNPDTKKWIDIATGSQKGYTEGGKILPAKTVDSIDTLRQSIQRLGSLKDAFAGEYGGHTLAGGWSTKFSELVGSDTGYTNWWKDYKELDAIKRHDLFGSQLTSGEKKSWDAITVNERSDSKTIQAAIANRLRLAEVIFNNKRDTLQKAGYDISGFEAEDVTPSAGFPRAAQPAGATAPAPTTGEAASGAIMAEMPDAVQYSGRTIVDEATGKRLKSDGKTWAEVR